MRRQECAERFLRLDGDGRFENRLGDDTRSGRFTVQGYRIVLRADDGEEQVMPVMDHAGDRLVLFDDSVEAGKYMQQKIQTGDVVLIKGSQGSRMEKIVKEIMAEPLRASELLVRQTGGWEKR